MHNLPIDITPEELGRRLTHLRKTLSIDSEKRWSQRDLADALDVSQNLILRAEHGLGSLQHMLRLILFYYQHGYNIHWILVPDNREIPMRIGSDAVLREIKLLHSSIQGLEGSLAKIHK